MGLSASIWDNMFVYWMGCKYTGWGVSIGDVV